MLELIRKLTSNYSEEEYKSWLWDNNVDFLDNTEDFKSGEKNLYDYAELSTTGEHSVFINKKYYKELDLDTLPSLDGTENFKDIAILLEDVANRTGYDYKLLSDIFTDLLQDGESVKEAFDYTVIVAFELDH